MSILSNRRHNLCQGHAIEGTNGKSLVTRRRLRIYESGSPYCISSHLPTKELSFASAGVFVARHESMQLDTAGITLIITCGRVKCLTLQHGISEHARNGLLGDI